MVWVYAAVATLWIAGAVTITAGAIVGHHTQVDSGGNLLLLDDSGGSATWWVVLSECSSCCGWPAGWCHWRARRLATGARPGNAASS